MRSTISPSITRRFAWQREEANEVQCSGIDYFSGSPRRQDFKFIPSNNSVALADSCSIPERLLRWAETLKLLNRKMCGAFSMEAYKVRAACNSWKKVGPMKEILEKNKTVCTCWTPWSSTDNIQAQACRGRQWGLGRGRTSAPVLPARRPDAFHMPWIFFTLWGEVDAETFCTRCMTEEHAALGR